MLSVLDVIVADDEDKTSDFWRNQPFVLLPPASSIRPPGSYQSLANPTALIGKRIGVPKMYIGKHDPAAQPIWVSDEVRQLWTQARVTLEALGATVEEVDFPLVTNYETPGITGWEIQYPIPGTSNDSTLSGPDGLGAYAWDDFLQMVNDDMHSGITRLEQVNPASIFPQLPGTLPDRYGNAFMNRTEVNTYTVESIYNRNGSIFSLPGLEIHLEALEAYRQTHLEQWMDDNSLDLLVWPAQGDIGPADAESNNASAVSSWRNGVFFSNGNYAIRQFGVPTVGVSMGLLNGSGMPMDLTFAGKAYDDNNLLSYAFAFESSHEKRTAPPLTPELSTDIIPQLEYRRCLSGTNPPKLYATVTKLCGEVIEIAGTVDISASGELEAIEVFVDGVQVGPVVVENGRWSLLAKVTPYEEPASDLPVRFLATPDQWKAMVVVVATARNGRSDGKLLFI
jgi:Asp-tRNA(Asn)/Glu-tRNA(Gln) amidotransferase A subunit family amidase